MTIDDAEYNELKTLLEERLGKEEADKVLADAEKSETINAKQDGISRVLELLGIAVEGDAILGAPVRKRNAAIAKMVLDETGQKVTGAEIQRVIDGENLAEDSVAAEDVVAFVLTIVSILIPLLAGFLLGCITW